MAGDVDDFADEEKAPNAAGFHGFAGEFASVDSASSNFGFLITFRRGRNERPSVELLLKCGNGGIRVIGRRVEFEPELGQALGEKLLEGPVGSGEIAVTGGAKFGGGITLGNEVKMDGLAVFPVRRDLENGRAAEPTMSKKHFLAEGIFAGSGSDDFGGDTGKLGVVALIGAIENERNQSGARRNDFQAELASEVVAKGGGAHFGDGEATGGDDESGRTEFLALGSQNEFGGAPDFRDASVEEDLNVGGATFRCEQVGDFGGGIVAQELAKRFFVVGNAMFFDEIEKVRGSETGERGFGEVRVSGNEVFRPALSVSEIAAATAGNEDFLADAFGMLQDSYAAAALPCLNSAKEAGGASAEN